MKRAMVPRALRPWHTLARKTRLISELAVVCDRTQPILGIGSVSPCTTLYAKVANIGPVDSEIIVQAII